LNARHNGGIRRGTAPNRRVANRHDPRRLRLDVLLLLSENVSSGSDEESERKNSEPIHRKCLHRRFLKQE
jgi:hypothetical protein